MFTTTFNSSRRAFTLVELLITISIVALLLAMLMPVLGMARETGRATKCRSNLRQMAQLTEVYAQDNRGRMPEFFFQQPTGNSGNLVILVKPPHAAAAGWGEFLPELLVCPTDETPASVWVKDTSGVNQSRQLSFGYNLELCLRNQRGTPFDLIPSPSVQAVFFDGLGEGKVQGAFQSTRDYAKRVFNPRHAASGNVAFADGHVVSQLELTDAEISGGQSAFTTDGNGNGGNNGNGNTGNSGNGNSGSGNGGNNGNSNGSGNGNSAGNAGNPRN